MAESRPGRYLVALWFLVVGMQHIRGISRLAPPAPAASTDPPSILAFVPYVLLGILIYLLVGLVRYRPTQTALGLLVICTWPIAVITRAFLTGYFSVPVAAGLAVIAGISGACAWYLLRRSYRVLWDPRLSHLASAAG